MRETHHVISLAAHVCGAYRTYGPNGPNGTDQQLTTAKPTTTRNDSQPDQSDRRQGVPPGRAKQPGGHHSHVFLVVNLLVLGGYLLMSPDAATLATPAG